MEIGGNAYFGYSIAFTVALMIGLYIVAHNLALKTYSSIMTERSLYKAISVTVTPTTEDHDDDEEIHHFNPLMLHSQSNDNLPQESADEFDDLVIVQSHPDLNPSQQQS